MAATDAAKAEPGAAQEAVAFDGLQEVFGASGVEAATGAGSAEEVDDGREEALIEADEEPNEGFHSVAGGRGLGALANSGRKMPDRRATWSQSFSSSAKVSWGARQRAMMAQCQPGARWGWCLRMISRKRRRTVLRSTAPPIFLPVMRPKQK